MGGNVCLFQQGRECIQTGLEWAMGGRVYIYEREGLDDMLLPLKDKHYAGMVLAMSPPGGVRVMGEVYVLSCGGISFYVLRDDRMNRAGNTICRDRRRMSPKPCIWAL